MSQQPPPGHVPTGYTNYIVHLQQQFIARAYN